MERSMEQGAWKGAWKRLMKGKSENCKLKKYKDKKMQSEVYEKLDEESHIWLQCNIKPKKVVSISSTRIDGGNEGIKGKERLTCRK